MVTNKRDFLRVRVVDFYNLPTETAWWQITPEAIESWDSLVKNKLHYRRYRLEVVGAEQPNVYAGTLFIMR